MTNAALQQGPFWTCQIAMAEAMREQLPEGVTMTDRELCRLARAAARAIDAASRNTPRTPTQMLSIMQLGPDYVTIPAGTPA
jgi:hypothetical protein